mgnify:CR=1 FL=1
MIVLSSPKRATSQPMCTVGCRFLPVGRHALFDHTQRDEDILLLLRKITGNTDSEHIGVLTIHGADALDVLFRHTGAIPVVNMDCVVLGSVLVVAVIEKAGDLGGVPTHHQLGALGGQRTEDRLKYLILDAGGLVDDIEDVVCMEALEGVRLAGRSSYGKPFLRVSFHVDLLFCPDQVIRQGRVVSQPLRNLSPQDVP